MHTPLGYYIALSVVLFLVGVLAILLHKRSFIRLLTAVQISFLGIVIFLVTVSHYRQSLKGCVLSFFVFMSVSVFVLVAWSFFVKFYKDAHITFDDFDD